MGSGPSPADFAMEPSQTLEALREESLDEDAAVAEPEVSVRPASATLVPATQGIGESLRDAWRGRQLLRPLGMRFLLKRVQGTKLGYFWLLFRPFMDSLGKALLFGGVLKVKSGGGTPYYLFLLCGLLTWRGFDRGLLYSARSFSLYRKMMKTFRFPLILVPLSGLTYPAFEVAIYWLVFLGAIVFYWVTTGHMWLEGFPQLLLVIPGLALLGLVTMGFVLWVSVLNAKARDVRQVMRFVMQPWLFITPVLYSAGKVPASLHWLVVVNPLTAPVELVKSGLIGAGKVDPAAILSSVVIGGVLFVSGLWHFNREAAKAIDAQYGMDDDEDDDM